MTLSSLVRSNADQILKSFGAKQNHRRPVDIETTAKSLGAEIVYKPMLCDGCLEEIARNRYLIKVNEKSNRLRQRFTIAHETAHIMLKLANRSGTLSSVEESFSEAVTLNNRSGEEEICNFVAASLLVPSQIAKQLSDWKSFSIEKIAKASRDWQVSISVLLWHVLTLARYEWGFMWFASSTKPEDPTDIGMKLSWGVFPRSSQIRIPKQAWLYASGHSPIDIAGNEERFYWKVKFDFDGLNGFRAIRVKAFGKGKEKKVLVVIYPKEFRPESMQSSRRLRQAILLQEK
jgi:hypothetical protein